jgi:predicted acylesterase/phospholipase RssA/CRP-like cAMP-binding protein
MTDTQMPNDPLFDRLQSMSVFESIDELWFRQSRADVGVVALRGGEVLLNEGDVAEDVFVITEGSMEVCIDLADGRLHVVGVLGVGDLVGEVAVLTGERRVAMVRASTDSSAIRIGADAFTRLLDGHTAVAEAVARAATDRLRRTLIAVNLVRHLGVDDAGVIAEIEQHVEWLEVPSGEWLFREGDPAATAYLVATGRLRAVRGPSEAVVGEIGRGELVGEMALLDDGVRTAGIYAIRDSQLVCLPQSAVAVLLERVPQAFLHLTRTILRRANRPSAHRHPEQQLSVAVVPISTDANVGSFSASLADAFGEGGVAEHLSSDRIDAILEREDIAQSHGNDVGAVRLVQRLRELESRTRFLVFEGDREWTPWTQRIVRQCDHLLLVGDARAPSDLSRLEHALAASTDGRVRPRSSLVIVHRAGARLPRGTSSWLESRSVDNVFHVRMGSVLDVERIARVLSGRAVSLVLGGGGARGFAHIGVVRALGELGIPIDYIGGTSIGSVFGGTVAQGLSDREMIAVAQESFHRIMDWTLPIVSVLSGKRISAALIDQFGGADIEDLWLPYFCVSTSLSRAQAVVHRRGRLALAIRASISIPGILPPVPYGDDLLVDGGLVNNVPVQEARRDNPNGLVLAVDVAAPSDLQWMADYGSSLTGRQALHALVRRRFRPSMLHETVVSSMLVASMRDRLAVADSDLADLYLTIDAEGCGTFDWGAVQRMADLGYAASYEKLLAFSEDRGAPWILRSAT